MKESCLLFNIILLCCLFVAAGHQLTAQDNPKIDSLQQLLSKTEKDTARVNMLNELAVELRRTDMDQAIRYANEAKELSESLDFKKGIADSYYSLARIEHANFKLPESRENYRKALERYESLGMRYQMGDILNKMGITFGMEAKYDESLECFTRSLEIRQSIGSKQGMAECYNNLGNVYRYQGDYKKAIDAYTSCLTLSDEMDDLKGMADAYNHIGIVYDYQGNYNMALEYYFKSLEIREKICDKFEIGGSYGNIGIVYSYLGDFDKALEYHLKYLAISEELDDKPRIGIACNNIGTVYENKGNYDLALDYYMRGLKIREEIADRRGISYGFYNIGNVLFKMNKYEEALDYQKKSLAIRKEIGYIQGIAYNQISISKIHKERLDHAGAIRYAENALKTGEEIGYPEIIREASELLHSEYALLGQYAKAYNHLAVFRQMSDSLNNAANIKKITQLEMQYEFDKIQGQERMIHEAEIKQQKQLRNFFIIGFALVVIAVFATLRGYYISKRANEEKAVLLKEIHHRVKNNLQIISSLLNLQSHSLEDAELRDAVTEGQNRVKSMALIHQSLYQSDRLVKIHFQDYMEQLIAFLSSTYKEKGKDIKWTVSAGNINLDIDTAIPLGLIVNELVSNAYKYAFSNQEQGEIIVTVEKLRDDKYKLVISDNGAGLPPGMDIQKTETLGLKLVNILSRQLKGELDIHSDKGAVFTLVFSEMVRKG